MTAYLARAVPWRAVTVVGVILAMLLAALSFSVARLWPLEGCAIGLLAGGVAWCFDEPSAAIVDIAPRTLTWRTVIRATGVVWLIAWWLLAIALTRAAFHGHAGAVALHGLAAALAVTATVTWRRATGTPVPGTITAAIVTPVAVFLALGRPYPQTIPLFPYVYGGPWDRAAIWWVSTAGLASLLLLVTLVDIRSIRNRARRPRCPAHSHRSCVSGRKRAAAGVSTRRPCGPGADRPFGHGGTVHRAASPHVEVNRRSRRNVIDEPDRVLACVDEVSPERHAATAGGTGLLPPEKPTAWTTH